MLASYLRVGECREEKCVSLVATWAWVSGGEMCYPRNYVWVGVGRRNVLASYLRVGGCREKKCVSLVATCVCMGVWKNALASYLRVGGCREERVTLVPMCWLVLGGTREPRTYMYM